MEIGMIHKVDIDHEMQQAYLDYAMSVIVSRALPDARDGLKPVHRRILYAMFDMGLRPESSYKKSARIVGEVLGKYHPHGDMAVYESMARMAQDFSMRYLLVEGQGNFGSVDGDPPAAMRYTEARMTAPAMEMLADIGKNTVNFSENFDATLTEPDVLPAAIPNLLVNGTTGIAVGMATSIPPHNLGEIINAIQYLLLKWEDLDEVSIEELIRFVQGPDFPTGGIIIQHSGGDSITSTYSTGRGQVTIQAQAHLEEMERGRNRIIVTELPYMTNKSSLIERIAELVREGRIDGIVDLRDESDRQGMRIVIELNKSVDPQVVLRDLYKHTPMQSNFNINMLALVNGEPRLLSLKQALRVYIEHRLQIVRRRSEYDLAKAKQRSHILEGLRVALKNLDEVINLIRKAADVETARKRLVNRFKLSDEQAQAILDLPLRRLAALERRKIEEEYKEVQAIIKDLQGLLKSPKKIRQVVGDELNAVKTSYGDRRKTHIVRLKDGETITNLLTTTELIPEKKTWICINHEGIISRTIEEKLPRIAGKEAPRLLIQTNTRHTLYLVGEDGQAAALPVHSIPESEQARFGTSIAKLSMLKNVQDIAAAFVLPPRSGLDDETIWMESAYFVCFSRCGMIKKTLLSELPGPSANLINLVKINPGDRLGWVMISSGKDDVLLVSKQGMAIRFPENDVRPMGMVATGVMAIKLTEKDEIAGAGLISESGEILLVTAQGKGKRVDFDQFPVQGRYGQGVIVWKLPTGDLISGIAFGKASSKAVLHFNKLMPRSIRFDEVPLRGRTAQGQIIQEIKSGNRILEITVPQEYSPPISKINRKPGKYQRSTKLT